MKKQICIIAAALAALPGVLQAQPDAHYVPGIEGITCATLPPPGVYFRDYNIFYFANQLNNGAGDALPGTFHAFTFATVPRAIWITDTKFLGGYIGGDVVVPFIYNSLNMNVNYPFKGYAYKSSTFGLGDAYVEGTLSWHPGQFDIGTAIGVNMPTGASGKPTSAGAGYWGPQLTLGATWYADSAKTWAFTILNRYEINSASRDDKEYDVTPGQAWTVEYGVSKSIKDICPAIKKMELGIVGYYQQRVTKSTGDEPFAELLYPYSRVGAVGPEVSMDLPCCTASLRYNYEYMAENRAQGNTVTLTFTKRF